MSAEILLNNRYQVIIELGRQTSRRTFQALDIETQQQVVVKVLYLGKDFDWQDLKLFEREAETLKLINHPSIPKYLDYFEFETDNDKGFGLVQTYVDAKSLEAQLQAGRRFSESEIIQLSKSLLEIINYLHQHQPPIIHRDIKPSNILLTNRSGNHVGDVYLVDFGSVQNIAAQEGGTITVVGTYGYMPPEQFGGRTKPASDLYSLGTTLIYLLTGLHPTELPQKDLAIQFRDAVDVSDKLGNWLEWMTEPSLNKRFASAQIAIDAIENPPIRANKKNETHNKLTVPIGTKIKLVKTDEKLEIILPPTGFGTGLIALISCLVPFAIGANFLASVYNQVVYLSIFVGCLQITAIALLIFIILSALFKRTILTFEQEYLLIVNQLFGWDLKTKKVSLAFVSEVKLIIDYYNTGIKENLILIGKELPLIKRKFATVFDFDHYSNLSISEREWLAREISDWLDLPIVESRW